MKEITENDLRPVEYYLDRTPRFSFHKQFPGWPTVEEAGFPTVDGAVADGQKQISGLPMWVSGNVCAVIKREDGYHAVTERYSSNS